MYENELWFKLLNDTNIRFINPERVVSVENINVNPVLEYCLRTLEIAEKYKSILNETDYGILFKTLCFCEVSKCGSEEKRALWNEKNFNLAIHNIGSAQIFRMYNPEESEENTIIYTLIYTHGLLGQYARGEIIFEENRPLVELVSSDIIKPERLEKLLLALNESVIAAVNKDLWNKLEEEITSYIKVICYEGTLKEQLSSFERLTRLFPNAFSKSESLSNKESVVYDKILEHCSLWYPEIALGNFSREDLFFLFSMIERRIRDKNISHISFYPLARTLYYDYEGRKKENIYKKRIIEFCLKEMREAVADSKAEEHVNFVSDILLDTMYFNVCFTPVCEKLIEFCVEAERSGFMDYQKNITTIFDLFGFRRDIFDRLNNEEKYLQTMNSVETSKKATLIDYATGNILVDVGSGGGILLDALEKKYPDAQIIGTDISANVIEALEQKIEQEKHSYNVCKHNFVNEKLTKKADTIIFSSILHEIFSYTEYEGKRFNILSVEAALKNASDSLVKGGRILIRDGILTDSKETVRIRLKNKDGRDFLRNYMKDFKGLTFLHNKNNEEDGFDPLLVHYDGDGILTADINFAREFLYTYTWGEESYSCEVNEQFGYLTIPEFNSLLEKVGMKIISSTSYLEEGYKTHLEDKVELLDGMKWEDIPSNCIIIAEKL